MLLENQASLCQAHARAASRPRHILSPPLMWLVNRSGLDMSSKVFDI